MDTAVAECRERLARVDREVAEAQVQLQQVQDQMADSLANGKPVTGLQQEAARLAAIRDAAPRARERITGELRAAEKAQEQYDAEAGVKAVREHRKKLEAAGKVVESAVARLSEAVDAYRMISEADPPIPIQTLDRQRAWYYAICGGRRLIKTKSYISAAVIPERNHPQNLQGTLHDAIAEDVQNAVYQLERVATEWLARANGTWKDPAPTGPQAATPDPHYVGMPAPWGLRPGNGFVQ